MTAFYSIDSTNDLAVHPDKDAAIKEAGATGAAFATEANLSEATASWLASRLVEVWNSFAGAPPFADLKEVQEVQRSQERGDEDLRSSAAMITSSAASDGFTRGAALRDLHALARQICSRSV